MYKVIGGILVMLYVWKQYREEFVEPEYKKDK